MISFIKKRIQSIIELKKERHFVPAVILGSYAMVIIATVLSIWNFMILGKIDNPFFNGLLPVASLFFPFYVTMIVIFAGREIIWCHMMMFKQTDRLFRWAIDRYSLNYYKKHKTDPPLLDKFSKIQSFPGHFHLCGLSLEVIHLSVVQAGVDQNAQHSAVECLELSDRCRGRRHNTCASI